MRPLALHERVTEHRANFYKLLKYDPTLKFSDEYLGEENDTYSLGGHLVDEHGLSNGTDFDLSYNVFILKNSSTKSLMKHLLMSKLMSTCFYRN